MALRRRAQKSHRLLKLIIWIIIIFGLIYYLFFRSNSPKPAVQTKVIGTLTPTLSPTPNPLAHVVQSQLLDAKGTYSVMVKNLRTGESYRFNGNHRYETASLYKVWTMAVIYQKIQSGELHEDDKLTAEVKYLNQVFQIPEEEAEQVDGDVDYTVSDALEKMIIISDNYAALLLTDHVKYSALKDFLKKNGLTHSQVGEGEAVPMTTPEDMVLFFEKLYRNKLANQENTNKMLSLLERTQFNDVIPKYLPEETKIAHKTGSYEFFSNDAGIIYTKKGDYILALFSESDVPRDADDRLAKISKAIYEYFKNQKDPEPKKVESGIRYDYLIGIIGALALLGFIYYEFKRTHTSA